MGSPFKYKYTNLNFFDKSGDNLNFEWNGQFWEGALYFDRVSVDLIENEHLFILDEVIDNAGAIQYITPTTRLQMSFNLYWEDNKSSKQIYLYDIQEGETPYIIKYSSIKAELPVTSYSVNSTGRKVFYTIDQSLETPLKINIALQSEEEGIYDSTLVIQDSDGVIIAKIDFYGETIGEDERFRVSLNNKGIQFNKQDELITRNSDINEPLPDWINTNNKRKELLIAGDEIYPFISSYKGLINAIKFFGYQDLRVKEYWLNIDGTSENFGKEQQIEIQGIFDDVYRQRHKNPLAATKIYRKTNKFGLFYDINHATDLVDEFGIPIVEDSFMFTEEEVLIKLFALRDKLRKEFLPSNARIVDITGEGIYFERFGIRTWTDDINISEVSLGIVPSIEVTPKIGYILDLRNLQIKKFTDGLLLPSGRFNTNKDSVFTNDINPFSSNQQYTPAALPGLINSINKFYELRQSIRFPYSSEKENFHGDEKGILSGTPIILTCHVPSISFDELRMSWNALADYTWDNLEFGNIYEIEWLITKPEPNPYNFSIKGKITDYKVLPHFLPYTGKYDVTVKLLDTFNNISINIAEEIIEVKPKEIELAAFTRFRKREKYIWDNLTDSWDTYSGSSLNDIIEGDSPSNSGINAEILHWYLYVDQSIEVRTQKSIKYNLISSAIDGIGLIINDKTYSDVTGNVLKLKNLISINEPSLLISGVNNSIIITSKNEDIDFTHSVYKGNWNTSNEIPMWVDKSNSLNPYVNNYGTDLTWDDLNNITWDEMWSTSWNLLQFNSDYLGGFRIRSFSVGDTITIGDWNPYVITDSNIDNLIVSLNSSTNEGIEHFNYVKRQDPNTSLDYIHAVSKQPGNYGWHFITSTGSIDIDPYTFQRPSWLGETFERFIENNPQFDANLFFLDLIDINDAVNPGVGVPAPAANHKYWVDHGYMKTEVDGRRRGYLPSSAGSGTWNNQDIKIFNSNFSVPLGVPVFFVVDQSEIPGKSSFIWTIYKNEVNEDIKLIEVRGKNFFIFRFDTPGEYNISIELTDSNGNKYYTKKNGFVKAENKDVFQSKYIN
jgi:hypothetical protein